MGRRNAKNTQRKSSCGTPSAQRLKYKEKVESGEWVCGVCEQRYGEGQEYCRTCYQELYYYCYVNNQLFVAKDDSYLDIYYQSGNESSIAKARKGSWEEGSEESSEESSNEEEVNLDWVEDLLL